MEGAALNGPVVVDASVATKWLLRDEGDLEHADALLRAASRGSIILHAPHQVVIEVAASIRKAVLNGRIDLDEAQEQLARWLGPYQDRLTQTGNEALLPIALPRCIALGTSLFDALYVVLAEELEAAVVTSDERLLRSPAGALGWVKSLRDVQVPESRESLEPNL